MNIQEAREELQKICDGYPDDYNGDFTPLSVAHGLEVDEFDGAMSDEAMNKIIRLMARISEASYRRGFQHGNLFAKDRLAITPLDFRLTCSLDQSPFTDSEHLGHTAIERLFMEYGELRNVGLWHRDS